MNILISRQGQKFGPYPVEQLETMLRAGNIVPTDLVFPEGAKEWMPLAQYLASPRLAPPPLLPSAAPPVMGDFAPGGAGQVLFDGKIISGTNGFSSADLEREVQAGGRFVMYSFCFSVLVMTFKRPSDIVFLKGSEDGFSHTLSYSMISLFAGWWGIPWGPVWTITTLVSNARGGQDLTPEVLTAMLGPARATAVCARRGRPAPAGGLMKIYRVTLVAVPLLIIGLIALAVSQAGSDERRESAANGPAGSERPAAGPGQAEFDAANRQINVHHGAVAFGNSPQAVEVAAQFSKKMKAQRETNFTAGKPGAFSASKGEFLTYCELRDDRCVFLVHVPELRRFKSEAQETLAFLAWETAQAALKEKGAGKDTMSLAVGVRGIALYDRVVIGKYVDDPKRLEGSVTKVETGSRGKVLLHSLFLPTVVKSNTPPTRPEPGR